MREIKFRAWIFIEEKMNYDLNTMLFEMTEKTPYSVNVNKEYGNRTFNVCDFYLDDDGNKILKQSKDAEIMEYTGLKDINGKDIYEGDIVNYEDFTLGECIGEVKFIEGGFYADNGKSLYAIWRETREDHLQIIGNIFENKELL